MRWCLAFRVVLVVVRTANSCCDLACGVAVLCAVWGGDQTVMLLLCLMIRRQEKLKRRRSITERPVNEGLERFKFWLGLPNNYYRDDWQ